MLKTSYNEHNLLIEVQIKLESEKNWISNWPRKKNHLTSRLCPFELGRWICTEIHHGGRGYLRVGPSQWRPRLLPSLTFDPHKFLFCCVVLSSLFFRVWNFKSKPRCLMFQLFCKLISWTRRAGLAEIVRYYNSWMNQVSLYEKVSFAEDSSS